MNFNEAVIHDLIMLENDMMKAQKDLKKLRRINVIEGIFIVYLLVKDDDKKCKKMGHDENDVNLVHEKRHGIGKKWDKKGQK